MKKNLMAFFANTTVMGYLKAIKQLLIPVEKTRDIWVEKKLTCLQAGKTILDAGCGMQRYKRFCEHLEYRAQDFGQFTGEGATHDQRFPGWEYGKLDYKGNVWNIDVNEDTFNAVFCTEVFEHIPYPIETIKEFSRILKDGGDLFLTAPFASMPHFRPYFFYSGFSEEWYKHFLSENGFEIVEITPNGNFFLFLAQANLQGVVVASGFIQKFVYFVFLIPAILANLAFSRINFDSRFVFGYHVHAIKVGRKPKLSQEYVAKAV